jgi:hypothetical protein
MRHLRRDFVRGNFVPRAGGPILSQAVAGLMGKRDLEGSLFGVAAVRDCGKGVVAIRIVVASQIGTRLISFGLVHKASSGPLRVRWSIYNFRGFEPHSRLYHRFEKAAMLERPAAGSGTETLGDRPRDTSIRFAGSLLAFCIL